MEGVRKITKLLGGIFLALGGTLLIVSLVVLLVTHGSEGGKTAGGIVGLLCFIFSAIGVGMSVGATANDRKRKNIIKKGDRYTGKIYAYTEDKAILVNNDYPVNTVVHYFDRAGIEREIIIPTKFAKGSGAFPIGATIDFVIYGSSSTWIDDSVRFDHIEREDELMDNKPVDQSKLNRVAVTCPTCGASYVAAQGYAATCPFCGHAVNL